MYVLVITIITNLLLILFSLSLLVNRGGNRTSNHILAAFFLVHSVCLNNYMLLLIKCPIYRESSWLLMLGNTFVFLWGPLLYFYINSVINSDFSISGFKRLHFLPFLLYFSYQSFKVLESFVTGNPTGVLLPPHFGFDRTIAICVTIILHIGFIYYLILSFRKIFSFKEQLIHTNAPKSSMICLNWLKTVVFLFGFVWLNGILNWMLKFLKIHQTGFEGYQVTLILFVGMNLLFVLSLRQSVYFLFDGFKSKYSNSLLTKHEAADCARKLIMFMEQSRAYLDPALTIELIASQLKISSRQLSQVINQELNKNFNSFINEYRIDEAKELLKKRSKEFKIIDVAFEVGFNSKSSFNEAFKKATEMTPREFVKNLPQQ